MAILQVDVVDEDPAPVTGLAEFSWGDDGEPRPARAAAVGTADAADQTAGTGTDALVIW